MANVRTVAAGPIAAAIVFVLLSMSGPASAATGWTEYSAERFEQAQAAGDSIVVDVSAEWCPTCRAQQPILAEMADDSRLSDTLLLKLDYDVHKDFLREHRVPRQSTILVFKGSDEVDRSVAETDRDRLRGFVFDAVAR